MCEKKRNKGEKYPSFKNYQPWNPKNEKGGGEKILKAQNRNENYKFL